MTSNQTRLNRCPRCGHHTEPGLFFCEQCGARITEQGGLIEPMACYVCGRSDRLNQRFCVFCGAAIRPGPGQNATAAQAIGAPALKLAPAAEPVDTPTISTNIPLPAAGEPSSAVRLALAALTLLTGAALGLAVSWLVLPEHFQTMIARTNWPRRGLVVYVLPARAKVLVRDMTGRHFTAGQTGQDGALAIPELAPGTYRVTISLPGYQPVVRTVEIDEKKPTVLGFPEKIKLESAGSGMPQGRQSDPARLAGAGWGNDSIEGLATGDPS